MCSIILSIGDAGCFAAANRDEMLNRPWQPPAEFWPGICGGRDDLAGGTWLALNRAGVMAAVLNREGTLGPAPAKQSRGTLPLQALQHDTAATAAMAIGALDVGAYRAFNLVVADAGAAFFIRGLGAGRAETMALTPGVHMITAGEPDDFTRPRIARHLPRFAATPVGQWGSLLGDAGGSAEQRINVKPRENGGFGTVCASLINLPRNAPGEQFFAAGPPDSAAFHRIDWHAGPR